MSSQKEYNTFIHVHPQLKDTVFPFDTQATAEISYSQYCSCNVLTLEGKYKPWISMYEIIEQAHKHVAALR